MGLPRPKPYFTEDDYLRIERGTDERYLYVDGEIYSMAGESLAHGVISTNIVGIFYNQLKGSPCHALTKDTKVRSGPTPSPRHNKAGMYSYPDVLVVCDEPKFLDEYADVLTNPKAILEVLSPDTEAFDRGEKFTRYQTWNPSLTDYLLVSQDKPQIEHFHQQDDGSWSYQLYTGLEATVAIESIRCSLKLVDVYDRVRFGEG